MDFAQPKSNGGTWRPEFEHAGVAIVVELDAEALHVYLGNDFVKRLEAMSESDRFDLLKKVLGGISVSVTKRFVGFSDYLVEALKKTS